MDLQAAVVNTKYGIEAGSKQISKRSVPEEWQGSCSTVASDQPTQIDTQRSINTCRRCHTRNMACSKQQLYFFSACFVFFLWASDIGHGKDKQRSKQVATPITYCDTVNDSKKYDGKEVSVRATYRYGFEWQELFCLDCRKVGKTWLEFDDDAVAQYKAALKKFPKHQGTVNAVFTGTFESSKGPYGDGGYRFKFVVRAISNAEVVSKSGWDPEHLPSNSRKKVCGG